MACVKNVAIVGAIGTIGKFIVEEFLEAGKHEVTAITRSGGQAVMPDGFKVANVNYGDQETLVAALRGHQVLIITLAPSAPKHTQLKLVEAGAEANVPFVVPNGWGLDPAHSSSDDAFLGPGQRAIQRRIEELGKSCWTEFVSGCWYEFSLGGTTDRYGFI